MIGLLASSSLLILSGLVGSLDGAGSQVQTANPLAGTAWELFAYRRTRPPEWMRFRVEFSEEGLHGFGGCNTFEGSYRASGDRFEILSVGWVDHRQCESPDEIMELEDFLFLFLQAGRRFRMDETGEGRLVIFRPDGEALTFGPAT